MELRDEMHPKLSLTPDGVSEFTFADLYLFRGRYEYHVSKIEDKTFIISGTEPPGVHGERSGKFFFTPCAAPGRGVLEELFKTHDFWKNISDAVLIPARDHLEEWGIEITEDRGNFDYLYPRTDLAGLPGKKYHKKRNLVNQFLSAYPDHEEKPLTAKHIPEALEVLERWREDKGADGDYAAAREALERSGELRMRGAVYYIGGKPAGWCLGEAIAGGKMFAVHFEKGIDEYKGIYQFINQSFAASLPGDFIWINREQDLDDEGLRQAKMTYRPSGFVRKYSGVWKNQGS
jgi:hypothetical protein